MEGHVLGVSRASGYFTNVMHSLSATAEFLVRGNSSGTVRQRIYDFQLADDG